MFDFLFKNDELKKSFFNIVSDKVAFKKQVLSKTMSLKEGEYFTLRIKDGVKIVIKLNNKCSMYHVYEDISLLKLKMTLMKDNDFLFLKHSLGYQMIIKTNGKIKQIDI